MESWLLKYCSCSGLYCTTVVDSHLSGGLWQEMWPEPGSLGLRTCPPHWPQTAEMWVQARTRWRLEALLGLSTQGSDHYHLEQAEQQDMITKNRSLLSLSLLIPSHSGNFHPHSPAFLTIDNGLELLLCVSTQLDLHKWAGDAAAWLRKVSGSNNLQRTTGAVIFP